jgi:hypothetical protein
MTAQELAAALAALTGRPFKRSGRQFVGPCVAHDDHNPSMIIFDGHTSVQVRCLAGCRQEDIVSVLKNRGLWDQDVRRSFRPSVRPAPKREGHSEADQRAKARWLWAQRRPIVGTPVELYLRRERGISCLLPATLGYLPARGDHPCAMIAGFGTADEIEPRVLALPADRITAVHLTKLTADGRKVEAQPNKIVISSPLGAPIMLAPMNDLLGLAVTEGIEDALTVHQATGLGAWAAGSASLLAALAPAVPDYADCVTILADNNEAGRRNSHMLADRLAARSIHAEIVPSAGGSP